MKTKSKALLLTLCAVLLVAASVMGTMAYLTSTDKVENTFTVGNVKITLDEAKVNTDGTPVTPAERVKANSYKLLPGHTYNKDPMVTVLSGSEASYIKMTVTFSKAGALDAIFASTGADLTSIFNGYDSANWIYKGNTKDAGADTRTYEFWYKETVGAPNADVALDALFDSITVPGTITNKQLETIKGMTITVNAYAIQADGFDNADAAWAAYAG
ncbi:MAG: SipW-dependent-type signal peptide-containing protein [Clostridiales bacterium]|nr:SipW-dependent-type signal peptide-containing protein [Clostridiales bacterium]